MLCPQCGANVGDAVRLCEQCSHAEGEAENVTPHHEGEENLSPGSEEYAGFWIRGAALIIDSTIVGVPLRFVNLFLTSYVIQPLLGRLLNTHPGSHRANLGSLIFGSMLTGIVSTIFIILLLAGAGFLYFAFFESSPSGATPGKRFCGLRVVGLDGEQISFWRATKRCFSRAFSMPLGIGYLFNVFTEKRQTLHDIVSRTVVVRTRYPSLPAVAGLSICMLLLDFGLEATVFGPWEKRSEMALDTLGTEGTWKVRVEKPASPPKPMNPTESHSPASYVSPEEKIAAVIEAPKKEEQDIWEGFPPPSEGPHAFIGVNGELVKAKLVLGYVYPAGNSISLGFFPEKLSPEEIAEFQKRGTLTSAVNTKRAILVLSIEFSNLSGPLTPSDVLGYTATFYADATSVPFHGTFRAASLTRKRESFLRDEVVRVSGNGQKGGRLAFTFASSGTVPSGGSNKVRWDLSGESILLGSK